MLNKQTTLDGTCPHMHIGDCSSLVMGGCSGVCLDCGEHGIKGGLGYKYLQTNSIERGMYESEKRNG